MPNQWLSADTTGEEVKIVNCANFYPPGDRRLCSVACLVVSLLLSGCAAPHTALYDGYRWQTLGNGIYLHTQIEPLDGPVDGNSVIVVSDTEVTVVDTHINPAVARAVIGKIQAITDKPVTRIVNTHWHDDHTNGNHAYRVAFPDAEFIAHRATLAALRDEWQPMEQQRQEAYASVDADELLRQADAMDDAERAYGYRVYAGYVRALKPELPTLDFVYPDTVFEDQLEFRSGDRRIIMRWLGRGNTDGDVVVWLPDDRVLITGDILVHPIPFAFDSPMTDWIKTLRRLDEFDAWTIVPGHGDVQHDSIYLQKLVALLEATVEATRDAHDSGVLFNDLSTAVDLSDFERQFTGNDPQKTYAWRAFYLAPGLKSAWQSLGYPLPAPQIQQ